ncbi:Long-chain fatty-acid-CoA ligase-like protein [Pleurostoma richardsiae]|uniref:Long-chain fatty-acid-CoA ligase-like protein n=1 Tax=Pleurostoma richardsiae TaxID=41990 RepID=A0AA38S2P1_9PEZI|nr:Long-chain fatty-acid-CoA ligase-like protein [Pleurostoma richardsiae]
MVSIPDAGTSQPRAALLREELRAVSGTWETVGERPPLLPHTIPEHFASVVSKFGDRPAVIARTPTTSPDSFSDPLSSPAPAAQETILTYAALDAASNSLAHALRSLGVKKGDRVAVSLGNCAEFATLTYAVFKLGAILVPLNPAFNAKQVVAALKHLEVELLIIGAVTDLAYKPCRGRSNLPLLQSLVPNLRSGKIESPDVPSLKTVVVVDNAPSHPLVSFPLGTYQSLTPYSTLLDDASSAPPSSTRSVTPDSALDPSETINIQFTSGTTSHPKAAMLSHTSILNNGAFIAHRMGLDPLDIIVCPPPLFHCFGSVLGYMATATTGAAIAFPSPAFDPAASLRTAADHRATGLYGVSTMFVAMLELVSSASSSSSSPVLSREDAAALPTHLRKGIAAGSSVPEPLMRRLYAALGLRDLVICYGMTETGPVSCMTSPADPEARRADSVGRAMPHTRVKVVDPADRRRVLPVGERGELAASGYLVMRGYWGDEARTGEVRVLERDDDDEQQDGGVGEGGSGGSRVWMYSGDEACMDAEGYVQITGRIKDLIIRGGENIHPLEIENCLFQHPLVAEASVVGVPDEKYGECVGAFVMPHRGVRTIEDDGGGAGDGKEGAHGTLRKEDVREWVRTHLSSHLVPKHVFWVDEYPKTASGKIQKYKLRDLAKKLVHGSGATES